MLLRDRALERARDGPFALGAWRTVVEPLVGEEAAAVGHDLVEAVRRGVGELGRVHADLDLRVIVPEDVMRFVVCLDPAGNEMARGLVNYSAAESKQIIGQPSSRIEELLGYVDEAELIHRDNLVLSH